MLLPPLPGLVPLALLCAAGAVSSGLPPVAERPRNAATAAASRRLVERARAAEEADKVEEARALLRQAVAAEPANHDARLALAASLLETHLDEALAILTELRDRRCRACLQAVTGFVWHNSADETVNAKLEALARSAHGPPSRVSRAADAVWKAFERQEWKLLAPYVGPKTRIKTINMATDNPDEDARSIALSPAAMRAWFETQIGFDLHRDESWFCTDRCCEYWSWDMSRGDVVNYLQKICFDTSGARPILTRLEWESG